ncbi:MAG: phosphoribosyltransferase family protein [Actinomycetota bacterium]|nr:phosphoribosyltransferase family protein [Actinomycetota bacterium]MDZ4180521.1 phosphoribosyltransferase family protein [Coriobacteriia bacterium]
MFRDRVHAGRLLAGELTDLAGSSEATVFGIPRGGVIVAAEVADKLGLPLDVVVTSKIGAPGNPEYAIGAIDADGAITQNVYAGYSMTELEHLGRPVRERIAHRLDLYRAGRGPELDVAGRTAVLVDDGIATGLTAFAAVDYLKRQGASHIVLAVPVISADAARVMRTRVDRVVALEEPEIFYAVGQFYRRFEQTSDDEVLHALSE